MGIRDIIVLAFFVASVPFCFLRPFYGILLWSVVAFLNPHRFAWAAQDFPFALLVGIPTLVGFVLFSREWRALHSREFFLIVSLWVWFTVTSLAAGNNPLFVHHIGETWDKWRFVSKVLMMTGVSMAVVNSFSRLRTFVVVIAGCFGALVLRTLPFMILTRGQDRLYGPNGSMIADNNDFGLALDMSLPLFFFLAQTEERRWVRRLFAFLFVITIPAIFCTYSRGALVGLVAVTGLMLLRLKQRIFLIPAIGLALVLVLLFAPQTWKDRMDPTREGALDASAQARLNAWAYARHLAYEYPITGGGFGTFTNELSGRYAVPGTVIQGPHSVYFGLLAEHGFVGLGLYLLLVAACFMSAHGVVKHGQWSGDDLFVTYANMFRFSLVGFLTAGIFLGRAYFDYFYAIVGCVAILKRVAYEEWSQRFLEIAETPAASDAALPILVEES